MIVNIYFDGACRGDQSEREDGSRDTTTSIGVSLKSGSNGFSFMSRLPDGLTNNQSEYVGCISALKLALLVKSKYPQSKIIIHGDSQLVVSQVNGSWRCNSEGLKNYCMIAKKDLQSSDDISLIHIKRHLNSDADELANRAIDEELPVVSDLRTLINICDQAKELSIES